jgi:hypothetical protein
VYGEAMKIEVNTNELTLCLKESLEGEECGSFEAAMKEDFRKLEVRFVCRAKGSEVERCTRYIYHCMGCTFKGEDGSCGAPQS